VLIYFNASTGKFHVGSSQLPVSDAEW